MNIMVSNLYLNVLKQKQITNPNHLGNITIKETVCFQNELFMEQDFRLLIMEEKNIEHFNVLLDATVSL